MRSFNYALLVALIQHITVTFISYSIRNYNAMTLQIRTRDNLWQKILGKILLLLIWPGWNIFRNLINRQGFIQALLLSSVFHEGLSFMALGYNLMCINTLTLSAGDSRVNLTSGVQGERSWKHWLFQRSHVFKYSFHVLFGDNYFLLQVSFFFLYGRFAPLTTPKG